MNVSVLSESPADEVAIRILVEGVLGEPTTPIAWSPRLPHGGGWARALAVLPSVILHLHYRTDADALVVVLDSDDGPVHQGSHDEPGSADEDCRLCTLRRIVDGAISRLRPVAGRSLIKVALGLAVPAIEAWYRFASDPRVTEAAWLLGLSGGGPFPYTRRQLKHAVYETVRPSLELETECAIREARRLVQNLPQFEDFFPHGFGNLARQVRTW